MWDLMPLGSRWYFGKKKKTKKNWGWHFSKCPYGWLPHFFPVFIKVAPKKGLQPFYIANWSPPCIFSSSTWLISIYHHLLVYFLSSSLHVSPRWKYLSNYTYFSSSFNKDKKVSSWVTQPKKHDLTHHQLHTIKEFSLVLQYLLVVRFCSKDFTLGRPKIHSRFHFNFSIFGFSWSSKIKIKQKSFQIILQSFSVGK